MVNFLNLDLKKNNKAVLIFFCLICLLWLLFSLTLATCYMNYDKNKIEMTVWGLKGMVIDMLYMIYVGSELK